MDNLSTVRAGICSGAPEIRFVVGMIGHTFFDVVVVESKCKLLQLLGFVLPLLAAKKGDPSHVGLQAGV